MVKSKSLLKILPLIALISAHLIWGGNFVVAKIALQEFPPSSLAFLRFAFAFLLLFPFLIADTHKSSIKRSDLPTLVAIGLMIITFNITFFFGGITRTSAINASVLTLTIPVISVVFGWWFLKESVYLINILGILLGFIGAALIVGLPQLLSGSSSANELIGNVLIIFASISWVIGAVLSRKMLEKYDSLTITAISFLVGAISLLLPAVMEYIQNPLWISKVTILGAIGLIYMTFLSSISAYFLFEWGLSKTSVALANVFQYVEPLIAAILAVFILDEQLTPYFLFGAILIGMGVYLGTAGKEIHHKRYRAHRT